MGDYEDLASQEEFSIKIKLSDGSSKDSVIKNTDSILKIKQKEFDQEIKEGKQVRFISQGKFMTDESIASSFSNEY